MKARLKNAALQISRRFNGRVFGWVFVALMVVVAVYALRQPRVYEARGVLKIEVPEHRSDPVVDESAVSCRVDVNTIKEVLASQKILQLVIERLTAEERSAFFQPYGPIDHLDEEIKRLIQSNRVLNTDRAALILEIRYRHPDRHMAALIARLHLEEMQAYEARVRIDEEKNALKELEMRAAQVGLQYDAIGRTMADYRQNRTELKDDELEKEEKYQGMLKTGEELKKLKLGIQDRLAEIRSSEKRTPAFGHSIELPVVPAEDDYLLGPLVGVFARGVALAAVAGVLAAVVFKRQGTEIN